MENRLKSTENLSKYQPPRDLEIYCLALVSQDVKGNKSAAQRLTKIDTGKFNYAWKTKQEFRLWYMNLCFDILASNSAIPPYALMSAILDKDVMAIRTYYELTGQLKNRLEHSGEVKGGEQRIIIIRNESKAESLPRPVHLQQDAISGHGSRLGDGEVNVRNISGNDILRADTK